MNKQLKEELIKSIELDCLYGWLCDNYYKINKEELSDIAKELAFALHTTKRYLQKTKQTEIKNEIISELKERVYSDEEGE